MERVGCVFGKGHCCRYFDGETRRQVLMELVAELKEMGCEIVS